MHAIRNSSNRSRDSGRSRVTQLLVDIARSVRILASFLDQLEARRSYSQFGEDRVIASLLPETSGSYLDVGAGHPIRNSNTYLLYRRGWRGVLVEPILSLASQCRTTRKRDIVLNSLIGAGGFAEGTSEFWEFTPSEFSTTLEDRANSLIKSGVCLRSKYECAVIPIRFVTPAISPDEPFLFSLDIEGLDQAVLEAIDWHHFRPRIVCIEDPHRLKGPTLISQLLESKGYELVSQHSVSSIYAHSTAIDKSVRR